uniref:C-type lectin domain-containing protein n=1 Tax=Dicentrarchus labrax TaxID=13489 RepID=A0A8C4H8R8_DICLA
CEVKSYNTVQQTSPQPPVVKESNDVLTDTRSQIGSIYTCEVENCCLCLIVSAALRFKLVHLKVPAASKSHDSCPKCEHGWEQHGRQCYYFSTDLLTWSKSRAECGQKGGDLVQIDSREEQVKHTALKVREKMIHNEDNFWIGLTDSEKEGTWLWVDGSSLNESAPDNWTGKILKCSLFNVPNNTIIYYNIRL